MSYAIEKWLKKKHKIRYTDIDATTRLEILKQTFQLLEDFVNRVFR